jgi:GH25 family lysozyme M1 (1,4-beta-N-acetylmuramidase)
VYLVLFPIIGAVLKRLPVLLTLGVAAATVTAGVAVLQNEGSAVPAALAAGTGLRPGEGYPGAGLRGSSTVRTAAIPAGLRGVDVSSHQTASINWAALKSSGVQWAYVKATESSDRPGIPGYKNPYFTQQYNQARNAGIIRGAYHFAQPHETSGAAQADFFVNHGGGWRTGGWTLPGVLDIENNPYGSTNECYNKTPAQMVQWIRDFSDRYRQRTGRYPVIYTNAAWWISCTANNSGFGNHPLWLASYNATVGRIPAGWSTYTFWQYAEGPKTTPPGPNPSVFNGGTAALSKLAAQARTNVTEVNAAPEPVTAGKPVTVSGRLNYYDGSAWKPLGGQRVTIQFRAAGTNNWVNRGTVTTGTYGFLRLAVTAYRDGYWRLTYPGGMNHFGVNSGSDYVDVR